MSQLRIFKMGLAIFGLILMSCGGSSSVTSAVGSAKIGIDWPSRTRLIPVAANSIKLTLVGPGGTSSRIVTRPDATGSASTPITFTDLVAGSYAITAEAFPNADATGTVQAQGTTNVSVVAAQTTPFTITLGSTVTNLTITPTDESVINTSKTLTCAAFDALSRMVLVDVSQLRWTADSNCTVNGLTSANGSSVQFVSPALGVGTVSVSYIEPATSQPTRQWSFNTVQQVGVSVAPNSGIIRVGDQQTFTATVTNATSTDVTWSLTGPASIISSTANSLTVQATADTGNIDVTATSVQNTARSQTVRLTAAKQVVVTVSPNPGSVTVGQNITLNAIVSNATNQSVTWTVDGGASIVSSTASSVVVSAPGTITSFNVTATSVADTRRSGVAVITTTTNSGSAGGTIQSPGVKK